ncbi:MAG: ParB N-terminal domain-containing protein [Paracoccaceae bacterium]|nr:MAG: ParB N-terminal domain-containing protein [Paracoccaceae bacterium]
MKAPTLTTITRVSLDEIDCAQRLRPASEAGIAAIMASIAEVGVMKDAIHVRRRKNGRLVLIAGLHRLEAARRLGWPDIEAKVWADVTDDWSRLMEIDDNLAGAELSPLDTAVFLAARKAVYERLHPETKRGVAGALARWDATEPSSVAFVPATAAKFGMTERQVYKIAAAGARIAPDQAARLRAAPRPVTLKDLVELSRVGETTERYAVIDALAEGRAKSAAEARRALRSPVAVPKDPVEEAFKVLSKAWSRAPMAARKRFLLEHSREVWHAQNAGPALVNWREAAE